MYELNTCARKSVGGKCFSNIQMKGLSAEKIILD